MSPRARRTRREKESHATEAELKLLEALWTTPDLTVRQLAHAVHGRDPSTTQYATAQSLLDRLEKKSLVHRDRSAVPHVYRAAIDRDTFIGRQLEAVASRTTGGALLPLLMNLVGRTPLSPDERKRLLELIDHEQSEERRP